jgi:hypothetical protein
MTEGDSRRSRVLATFLEDPRAEVEARPVGAGRAAPTREPSRPSGTRVDEVISPAVCDQGQEPAHRVATEAEIRP